MSTRFSERVGKKTVRTSIQLEGIDEDLRNGLWNVVYKLLIEPMVADHSAIRVTSFDDLVEEIWFHFFKEPVDGIDYRTKVIASDLRKRYFSWNYLEIYDFIDFLAGVRPRRSFDPLSFAEACNFILKRDLSGYRFVNGQLAPITSETEIAEIERAFSHTEVKFKGVYIHLTAALQKVSDKKNPDYRNSIKESISAVESVCQIIANDPKAELGKALKVLKDKIPIHGALEQGFIKLYGYTSDGDGIRHALLDESSLDQEDALFMLVSCSSFVNYLIAKSQKVVNPNTD